MGNHLHQVLVALDSLEVMPEETKFLSSQGEHLPHNRAIAKRYLAAHRQ
jgi:hypothetical protein